MKQLFITGILSCSALKVCWNVFPMQVYVHQIFNNDQQFQKLSFSYMQ